MRYRQNICLIISLILMLCMLSGCGEEKSSTEETISQQETQEEAQMENETTIPESAFPYDETAMYKDIEDFIGENIVVDLGNSDNGKENFVAYSKETVLIEQVDNYNEVLSFDYEKGEYVIANPSEELLQLQEGEIFLLPPGSKGAPNGVSGKIGSKTENSDGLITIQLAAAELHEIYSYIAVDTVADASSISYDESLLEEGMSVAISSDSSNESNVEENPEIEGHYLIDVDKSIKTDIVFSFSTGYDLSAYANGKSSSKGFTNNYSFSTEVHITSLNIKLMYNAENQYFYSDISFNCNKTDKNTLSFSGTWSNGKNGMGKTWPAIKGLIPGTVFVWQIDAFQLNELSGTYNGNCSYTEARHIGFCFKTNAAGSSNIQGYNKMLGNTYESSIEVEGKLESSLGVRTKVGLPYILNAYMDTSIGAALSGELDILESSGEGDKAEIHDCRKCIDGDFYVFLRGTTGVDFEVVEHVTQKGLVFRGTVIENKFKIGDFYASYRDNSESKVECGTGECPHKRYKVTIYIKAPDGGVAKKTHVSATYPDKRTDNTTADNKGVAILYLPDGDNLLKGNKSGLAGTTHVIVDGKPTETTLKLQKITPILILINTYETYDNMPWYELEEGLMDMYPGAEFGYYDYPNGFSIYEHDGHSIDEYDVAPGTIVIEIVRRFPQMLSARVETKTSEYEGLFGIERYEQDRFYGSVYSNLSANIMRVYEGDTYEGETYLGYDHYASLYSGFGIYDNYDDGLGLGMGGTDDEHLKHVLGRGKREELVLRFSDVQITKNYKYKEYDPSVPSDYGVTYKTSPGILDEYTGLTSLLSDLENIRQKQTDYCLGQIDFVVQLMLEEKDLEGYIPLLDYPITDIYGEEEFTRMYLDAMNNQ